MADVVNAPKALIATVVAVCTPERISETSSALVALRRHSGVRTVLISLGTDAQPPIDIDGDVIAIEGLLPRYLNNAVASLRLSSLPSVAWWRGGDVSVLPDLAELVDRLVLDSADPREAWKKVPDIAPLTVIGDLRWTQLTRWRNLMAQFFDVPHVRESTGSFSALHVTGSDPYGARLFAGWMQAQLPEGRTLAVEISPVREGKAIQAVSLSSPRYRLSLVLMATSSCIETSVGKNGEPVATRIVPLGEQTPDALIAQELRIRARDVAFERAVEIATGLS